MRVTVSPAEAERLRKRRRYLELLLKDELVEGRPEYTLFSHKERTSLPALLELIEAARCDRRIAGMSVTVEDIGAGWSRLSSLRRALLAFRAAGKPVFCFLQAGGNLEYYLASSCSRIFMPPSASLQLVGLAAEVFFFKDLLERCGIHPQLQAVGEYKSAGEMFTRTGMSDASREQMEALLDDFYLEFRGAIASSRGQSPEEVAARIDGGPYSAREALQQGLIDGLCYPDEVPERLKQELGADARPVAAGRYRGTEGYLRRLLSFRRPRIAVINIHGTLQAGESRRDRLDRSVAGSSTIGRFLEHARETRRVRAVVIRVDSPGGTAVAADAIWRKVDRLRAVKPVVVSFGDVAASGGYYLAAAATAIVAESTCITGSIGVLGGKFVARDLMQRLAVHRESLHRGSHAEFESFFRPFSQAETDRLEAQLQDFYREDFIKKVAAGRGLEEAAVDAAGRGRVWSGLRARERGLVDLLGGPQEALAEARRRAGIPEDRKVRLLHYARRRRLSELLIPEFRPRLETLLLHGPLLGLLDFVESASRETHFLRMPCDIRIR